MARTRDSTAVAILQRRPDGRLHVKWRIWLPAKDAPIDPTDVMAHLRELDRVYQLVAVSYDPRFFDVPAKMLDDEGLPMVEVPQSLERMTPACGSAYELIGLGGLSHDGDLGATTQVLDAVARFNERGFTLAKGKSRGRIDAAVAMCLGVDAALRLDARELESQVFVA
jgi:phage terminase large subunit-like protein